jgi:hypothetical protein
MLSPSKEADNETAGSDKFSNIDERFLYRQPQCDNQLPQNSACTFKLPGLVCFIAKFQVTESEMFEMH